MKNRPNAPWAVFRRPKPPEPTVKNCNNCKHCQIAPKGLGMEIIYRCNHPSSDFKPLRKQPKSCSKWERLMLPDVHPILTKCALCRHLILPKTTNPNANCTCTHPKIKSSLHLFPDNCPWFASWLDS